MKKKILIGCGTILLVLIIGFISYKTITKKSKDNKEGYSIELIKLISKEKNYDIFTRNGEEVQYKKGESEFLKTLKEYNEKSPSVAIITKTIEEARELHKELIKEIPGIRLCDNKSCVLSEAPIIMPLVLTKGLEFDSVIVFNKNKEFSGENNNPYLYMAVTRALHRLSIIEVKK